ncbi:chromosome segregation protein SMC [Luteococcus sp. Sow4_B9]|uniref:chromosome segregation protein SMC n=1 Tax=Luteococcus sp. Sow4_B9 TaxID=3438792 RepID=UPI003F95D30C
MYLKSLTLRGFKSFASATTLNFEPGITCVVGPNGSGKSNVVDALSWVMGEQGAKSLRGGKMEDVIFAGTSGRAPLGRAEVSLTIDNTDGALPIEYTEVTITRTMFRNGGSEYSINGHQARLLDVQELLSDSGIGREMHVIVGQGQLDTILQATPEIRRGFIEEAAGVLKHRKRKEKALRKLDATQQNLDRLQDLVAEIRRQLKPLGRQAEVARKAAVVQSELRDAKARLLGDDLTQATIALETDLADEANLKRARAAAEARLEAAREAEHAAELALAQAQPRLNEAQETWYALAALRERVSTTQQIAAERMRHAEAQPETGQRGRDPELLEQEAAQARAQEHELRTEVEQLEQALQDAQRRRSDAETAHAEADRAHATQLRAIADRREGLARLTGQVNSLKTRLETSSEQVERLTVQRDEAALRAESAAQELSQASGRADEHRGAGDELARELETASSAVDEVGRELQDLRRRQQEAQQLRAGLVARIEALEMGLDRTDAPAALLGARDEIPGILGQLAELIGIESGWEVAIAAALGSATDSLALDSLADARRALEYLEDGGLGRVGLLLRGASRVGAVEVPDGFRSATQAIDVAEPLQPALDQLIGHVVLVEGPDEAIRLVQEHHDLAAVTRSGDLYSSWYVEGGSAASSSRLEIQAAIDQTRSDLEDAQSVLAGLETEIKQCTVRLEEVNARRLAARQAVKLAEKEASDLARQVSVLAQAQKSARAEADRLEKSILDAQTTRVRDEAGLADLEARLANASAQGDLAEPDSSERDRQSELARTARTEEMDARLALRTAEERVRALAGRADSLRRAAVAERQEREKAAARAAQLRREAEAARAVHEAAGWLLTRVDESRRLATVERAAAEEARQAADAQLAVARRETRELARELEKLVEGAHRDEMARIEVRMRIEQLTERAMTELGLEASILMSEYGPDQFVPVLTRPDGTALTDEDEVPDPVPYVREQQAKRLRAAERNLQQLGRINPLALEEFDAMQERHAFLAEQLEDLKQTRKDLMDIVEQVDRRVEEVFAAAYLDVERTFNEVFPRLFPGGEGRLVLTEPGQWLTTGVDVEARPAGKKVKRLSLLSGGERSLVAVAFLVSLFMARPSPFYILDEVEAALDDANLGRLLGIYEQLRESSQLLVITHQKRTMEIADALYGVTMRGDGVSTVISQRLHRDE